MDHTKEVWGSLAFRGVIATLFGIAAVFWPNLTLKTLVYLFAGFILAMGLVTLVGSLTNLYNERASFLSKVLTLILGVVQIGVGVYLLRHPLVSFATFILLIGFTLILAGVFDIVSGLLDEGSAMYKTVMVVGGLIATLAGVVLLFQPETAGVAFVWVLGLYALITGPLLIALAMDVKKVEEAGTKGKR